MNKWLVTATLALSFTVGLAQAAGNAEDGKNKSAVCAGCHGAEGNSPLNPVWPKIAGQHPAYIEKQIKDFKANKRSDPMMSPMAAPLSDQDIADLAAYYSSQTIKTGVAAADKVEAGERLYRAGNADTGVAACMACHGPSGAGNPQANFPAIAGQHATYVEKALKDFRAGTRTNDASKMMQGVVERMTDEEMAEVAQYIQGLSR
ncbi:MAG: cytochrome c4 [Candidatus Thiodiazotropha lotti]|uniref:Cytochrome C n=1 Tax=Candidatus Thiodiazotropha endoloripes TaxID=1818881 RepID=A0A1E2UNM1_9GAMM|nr:c-type cytochrome [Candidatus Thiodiazotropha endoloripes]MCG7900257.1 cytochrome c4 [Candidatus Thiodiazotropha weberae]MCG7993293.1 cytochrome c4 [Candidatus Thiodiazotropha lotti]MCG7903701.1 cytochrome c4 [Candidatus Thiodiazotropha weberae]MCG7915201.1 cytochrome c4 [Candidatus Thiodiazotropha weberae]MCG7998190.1 cytochrome c4 [Candidatus Thiodiazotropha lotti]